MINRVISQLRLLLWCKLYLIFWNALLFKVLLYDELFTSFVLFSLMFQAELYRRQVDVFG